jgi:hypothetical protein
MPSSKIIWIHASRVAKLIGRNPYEPRATAVHELGAQILGHGAEVRASHRLEGTSDAQVIAAASALSVPVVEQLRTAVDTTIAASVESRTAIALEVDMQHASRESSAAVQALAHEVETAERLADAAIAKEARIASNARAASCAAQQASIALASNAAARDAAAAAIRAAEAADLEAANLTKVIAERALAKAHVEQVRAREALAREAAATLVREAAQARVRADEARAAEHRAQRELEVVRAQASVQVVARMDAAALASESNARGPGARMLASVREVMPVHVEKASRMAAGTAGERSILERARETIRGTLHDGTVPTRRRQLGVIHDGAYTVMLTGVADGLTDDTVVEIKKRRARLLGVPDYERVQCACYMHLYGRSSALLVEEYAGNHVAHPILHNEIEWVGIVDGIMQACRDALSDGPLLKRRPL